MPHRRIWAIIMLIIFLLGLGVGVYSIATGNNALGMTSIWFIILAAIGTYFLRRDLRREIEEEERKKNQENDKNDKSE